MKTRGSIMLKQGNQINTKTKQQPKRWTRKYQQQSFLRKNDVNLGHRSEWSKEKE